MSAVGARSRGRRRLTAGGEGALRSVFGPTNRRGRPPSELSRSSWQDSTTAEPGLLGGSGFPCTSSRVKCIHWADRHENLSVGPAFSGFPTGRTPASRVRSVHAFHSVTSHRMREPVVPFRP